MSTEADNPSQLTGGGLGYALARAAHAWRSGLAERLSDLALTPPQFFVLAALLHAESTAQDPPTQRQIAQRAGIDANTASQIVRGLQRRGLLDRAPAEHDARALALSLTAEGRACAVAATDRARRINSEFFAAVPDQRALFDLLMALAASEPAPPAGAGTPEQADGSGQGSG